MGRHEKAAKKTSKKLHFFCKNVVARTFHLDQRHCRAVCCATAGHPEGWETRTGTVSRADVFPSRRFAQASEAHRNGLTRRGNLSQVKGLAGWISAESRRSKESRDWRAAIRGAQPSQIQYRDTEMGSSGMSRIPDIMDGRP